MEPTTGEIARDLRPPQPYPSWVWDDGAWTAPVPHPDDGNDYVWDEDAGVWVEHESDDDA